MRNSKRFAFIENLRKTTDFVDILTVADAYEMNLVEIGTNCEIQSGAIIGVDGFGYERAADGKIIKFPHLGKVKIGNNVHVHGPTVICRGSRGDTIIGDGTKIAGNCQIGHNVNIGRHCLIGPHSVISGSVKLQDFVNINAHVVIDHGITIGHHSEVGAFSYVKEDIPYSELQWGIPSKKIKNWSTV